MNEDLEIEEGGSPTVFVGSSAPVPLAATPLRSTSAPEPTKTGQALAESNDQY
jgi:hypothetical protein